jgi:hypothetical protein
MKAISVDTSQREEVVSFLTSRVTMVDGSIPNNFIPA